MQKERMRLSLLKAFNAAAGVLLMACGATAAAEAADATIAAEPNVTQLQAALSARRTTVAAVARHYLQRIDALDVHGPALHSIIQVNPDAATLAAQLDAAPAGAGILFGVPVVIKDNIDTADGMLTTAGSLALVDSKPKADAFLVRRLRASGALILAKTNLSEWADFRANRATSGWSGRGGLTLNPLRHHAQRLRFQFRIGSRGCRGSGDPRRGHRDRRFNHLPREFQWTRRHQADGGTGVPVGHHSDQRRSGHRRADGAERGGRCSVAHCVGRIRSG